MLLQESRDITEEQLVLLSVSEVRNSLLSSGNSRLSLCEEEEEKKDDGNAVHSTLEHPGTPSVPKELAGCVISLGSPKRPCGPLPKAPSLPAGHRNSIWPRKRGDTAISVPQR